jgi:hypothetical protein
VSCVFLVFGRNVYQIISVQVDPIGSHRCLINGFNPLLHQTFTNVQANLTFRLPLLEMLFSNA